MEDWQARIIGDIKGTQPGPLVVLVGSMHGNEPAGSHAISAVFQALKGHEAALQGRMVGVVGNPAALAQNRRFRHYDLNRCWTEESWQQLLAKDPQEWVGEDEDFYQLHRLFESLQGSEYTQKVCVDLHTTSAKNGNFMVVPEEEANVPLLKHLHLPVVVDLAKYLRGTLLQFLHPWGYLSFALEGGQLGSAEAAQLHESACWTLLAKVGALPEPLCVRLNPYPNHLTQVAAELPAQVQVRYHHRVAPTDKFKMRPGYVNFMPIAAGEHLADDVNGPILAPCGGLMFMPLYQDQGEDGFFIVAPLT